MISSKQILNYGTAGLVLLLVDITRFPNFLYRNKL